MAFLSMSHRSFELLNGESDDDWRTVVEGFWSCGLDKQFEKGSSEFMSPVFHLCLPEVSGMAKEPRWKRMNLNVEANLHDAFKARQPQRARR